MSSSTNPPTLPPVRTILIGDVHGCVTELQALTHMLGVTSADNVILLGDLLDKGPFGPECVRLARTRGWTLIRGNHEDRYIRYREHEVRAKTISGYFNPMRKLEGAEAAAYSRLTEEDHAYLAASQLFLAWEDTLVVHAGVRPEVPWTKQARKDLLNIGGETDPVHWTATYNGPAHVIYGHSPTPTGRPRIVTRNGVTTFGIDTGCVHGGRLTAMVITPEEVTFESVAARKTYVPARVASFTEEPMVA